MKIKDFFKVIVAPVAVGLIDIGVVFALVFTYTIHPAIFRVLLEIAGGLVVLALTWLLGILTIGTVSAGYLTKHDEGFKRK